VKGEEITGALAVVGLFIVAPLAGALIVASVKLGPVSVPIWIAAAVAGAVVLRGPLGQALASRLKGDATAEELQGDTLAELDDLRARVAELEERQDFSERMLAQKGEAMKLPGGGA
jgi:hypothetical protein